MLYFEGEVFGVEGHPEFGLDEEALKLLAIPIEGIRECNLQFIRGVRSPWRGRSSRGRDGLDSRLPLRSYVGCGIVSCYVALCMSRYLVEVVLKV